MLRKTKQSWTGVASLLFSVCIGCSDDTASPAVLGPSFNAAASDNAALVEVGEHSAPFGLVVRDRVNGLIFYYRWDNGFCGGTTPTEFVKSTFRDVLHVNEAWRTLDQTDGFWFYVYDWNGTASITCAFLLNNVPLATGRGHRTFLDNDYYPIPPYGPGPYANAFGVVWRGSLTTPAGDAVQFHGREHGLVLPDGETLQVYDVTLMLSPDPR
jgi:hypothetical protein